MTYRAIILLMVACVAAAGGCGPEQPKMTLEKAMASRVDNQADYNAAARFVETTYMAKHDKDYVMWAMDYSSLCLMGGNYDVARDEMMNCYKDIGTTQDKDKETIAAISSEAYKIFKGEPFERALLCTYIGLEFYMDGDYNDARIFFARADQEDATTGNDMADFRHDFQLAHYWLGRSYLKLGQADNARIAFTKAGTHVPRKGEDKELKSLQKQQADMRKTRMELEAKSYKNALSAKPPVEGAVNMSASPSMAEMPVALPGAGGENGVITAAETLEKFLAMDFQKDVNLILVIEMGQGPYKYVDEYGGDHIIPLPYPDRQALVYLNGHTAGQAFNLLDMYHQAATRGTSEKDTAQAAKGVTKAVLKQMPFGVGSLAGVWDVSADWRYWRLLPGQVAVFAAKVAPGSYTVNVQCFDSNGNLLPRYSVTRYFVPVVEGRENIYMIHTTPEADNVYVAKK
jgi:tetratricopeptide (TPR) repeat protein